MIRPINSPLVRRTVMILIVGVFVIATLYFNISALYQQSIRLDEAQSLWFSTKPVRNLLQISAEDVHMPLYYLMLHVWLQIFGVSVMAARSLSLIFFLLTLPFLYLLAKEDSGSQVGFLAVLFFAISPFVVWYSSETRMYSLFILMTTVSSLYFLRFVKSRARYFRFELFVALLIGFYTHYFFVFVAATQGLYLVLLALKSYLTDNQKPQETLNKIKRNFRVLAKYSLILLASLLFVLPWVYYFISLGAGARMQPLINQPTSYTLVQTFVNFVFGFQQSSILSFFISLWPLFTIIIFLAFSGRHKIFRDNTVYFLLLVFIPILSAFVVSYYYPVFLPRYFIFVTPALFYLIALVINSITGKVYSAGAVIFAVVLFGFMTFQTISANAPVKEDYEEAAKYLEKNATPQDIIAITPPFTIYPLEYNYKGSARLETLPVWDRFQFGPIPAFSENEFVDTLEMWEQTYQEVFILFSYDQGYETDIRDYMDNNYHLSETKEFSYDLSLRAYQLRYD